MISTTVSPGLGSSGVCHSSPRSARGPPGSRPLVVGIDHRDQAGVGGALDVVLPAQRMQAGAGPADLAGDQRQRDQAARVVGAVDVLRDAHAPEDHRRARRGRRGARPRAASRRRCRRSAPSPPASNRATCSRSSSKSSVCAWTYCRSYSPSSMIVCIIAFSIATSLPGLNCSMRVAWRRQRLAARVHHDQLGAALGRLLEEGRGDRVVLGRVGADDDDHVGVGRGDERRRDGARADPLHQRRDRRGVAEPRAVVDVVAAEAGAHQLLEQVRLLVRALGRAEAGQRPPPVAVADALQALGGDVERLFPARLAEMRPGVGRVDLGVASSATPALRISGSVSRCGWWT